MLEAIRGRHEAWMERLLIAAGPHAADSAWGVRLAADGLWYSDLLGLAPPAGVARARAVARLLALAEATIELD